MLGIFDSGVGGLSVLRRIREKAPQADVVYFGDINNAPYGVRSEEELKQLTATSVKKLLGLGADDIVSACNSVSAHMTMDVLNGVAEKEFGVIEMVGPATRVLQKEDGKIAVFATPATISAGMYQKEFAKNGREVSTHAIAELAGAIEAGEPEEHIRAIIAHALDSVDKDTDVIMLSCTHYPLVRDVFEKVGKEKGMDVRFFDPAEAVAEEVKARFDVSGKGSLRFFISKESSVFERLVKEFFGDTVYTIEVV